MSKKVVPVPPIFSYTPYIFENCVTFNKLIFITGQAGIDKQGTVVADEIGPQAEVTFKYEHALQAAGLRLIHTFNDDLLYC